MKDIRKILLLLLLLSSGSGVCLQAQEVKAPEKDVKRANLWARQYVDKVSHQMVPYLEKSADFDAIPRGY